VDNILGGLEQENRGIYIALNALDHGRCGIAAQAIGIIQAVIEQATRYASERVQFGKEIINFEAVQWILADMAIRLDAARLLTYRAAYLRDLAIRGEIDCRATTIPADGEMLLHRNSNVGRPQSYANIRGAWVYDGPGLCTNQGATDSRETIPRLQNYRDI